MEMKIRGEEFIGNVHKAQLAGVEVLVGRFLEENPGVKAHEVELVTEYRTIGEITFRVQRRGA